MLLSDILAQYNSTPYSQYDNTEEWGYTSKFRNTTEMLYFIKNRLDKNIYFSKHNGSKQEKDDDFNSHNSIKDAINYFVNPQDIVITAEEKDIILRNQKKAFKYLDEPSGAGIDIPRFLSGSQEYFPSFTTQKLKIPIGRTVFLFVDADSNVSNQDLTNYIRKSVINIYNKYYMPRVIVTIVAKNAFDTKDGSYNSFVFVDLPFKDTAKLDSFVFADFLRRLCFFILEQNRDLVYYYGSSVRHIKRDTQECDVFWYYEHN